MNLKIFLLLFLVSHSKASESAEKDVFVNFEDLSVESTSFQTDKLPTDEKTDKILNRYMATIGNGHLGTVIYSDAVFINGVFNGFKGESHRARVPSRNNIQVQPAGGIEISNHSLTLDVQKGIFVESFVSGNHRVEHRIFAHRFYHTVIVNQIQIQVLESDQNSAPSSLELEITLKTEDPANSLDFDFEPGAKYESVYSAKTFCGRTKEVEDLQYQKEKTLVCVISSDLPQQTLTFDQFSPKTLTFFTAYGKSMTEASRDFDALVNLVAEEKHAEILESHAIRWSDLWNSGRIEIEGNSKLAKIINGCFYYILSSLPIVGPTNANSVGSFYGISPGGISNGGYLTDFQGHVFWDMEIWIFPSILYFFPEMAKELLNYRLQNIQVARDLARETGFKGARFGWESAFTGSEVTPDCCPETRDFQIHISADISFAIRQYISLTRDFQWLREIQPGAGFLTSGLGLLAEIAEFWISKMTFDPISKQHEILHVMSPDDDHSDKDNSVYTNVVAAYAIFFAKYAECLVNSSSVGNSQSDKNDDESNEKRIPVDWTNRAKSLKLIFDPLLNFHPEYENYPIGEPIKQADVVLLGFPLIYKMAPETRKNDLLIYGNATRSNGPGMTWSMHTIAFLELDDLLTAEGYFNRSYQPYVRAPFNIWTESAPPTLASVNYLTGMGGFLQAVINGYGGIRLLPEKMIFKPRLLPQTKRWKLVGLKFLGNSLDLEIEENQVTLTLAMNSAKYSLDVEFPNGTRVSLTTSRTLTIPNSESGNAKYFEVKSSPSKCPLPLDEINHSYEFNAARNFRNTWPMAVILTAILIAQLEF